MEPPLRISGDAERYNHRVGNDDYSQPRALHDEVMNDARARPAVPQHRGGDAGRVPMPSDRALAQFDKVAKPMATVSARRVPTLAQPMMKLRNSVKPGGAVCPPSAGWRKPNLIRPSVFQKKSGSQRRGVSRSVAWHRP